MYNNADLDGHCFDIYQQHIHVDIRCRMHITIFQDVLAASLILNSKKRYCALMQRVPFKRRSTMKFG